MQIFSTGRQRPLPPYECRKRARVIILLSRIDVQRPRCRLEVSVVPIPFSGACDSISAISYSFRLTFTRNTQLGFNPFLANGYLYSLHGLLDCSSTSDSILS